MPELEIWKLNNFAYYLGKNTKCQKCLVWTVFGFKNETVLGMYWSLNFFNATSSTKVESAKCKMHANLEKKHMGKKWVLNG